MATRTMRVLSVLLVVTLALATFISPALAQDTAPALVRFVHAIPGAAAVDIFANDTLTIAELDAGSATAHLSVPAGDYSLRVTQAGSDTVLWEQDVTLAAGSAQTLIATSTEPLSFQSFQDDLAPLRLGTARFTAIHAIPDAGAVDVLLADGRPVVSALEFGQTYGTLDIPALTYQFAVVNSGESLDAAIVPTTPYPLSSGTSYALVVYGTAEQPQTLLLVAPANADGAAGHLRVTHAFPGAGAVDVLVNNTVVAPSLAYGSGETGFMALPPDDYQVLFREAGTEVNLATVSVTLAEDSYVTVAVFPAADGIGAEAFTTDVAPVNATEAIFNVVNLLPEGATTSVALNDGTTLSGDVTAGASSAAIVEPADSGATVSVADGNATRDLALMLDAVYGGVVYDVYIVQAEDGPEALMLAPVSLAQSIGSAPGAAAVAVVEPEEVTPEEVDTEENTEVVMDEPTTAPVEEPVPTEAAPVETQPAPTEAAPTPAPPTAAPTESAPTARVLLDPGANLQLRQYPSSQALSLGLAPSGSTLTVVGRQGAEVPGPFETPDPEATEWVDPASLLGEGEFLDRLETWLFVSYETDDGGQIDAWVNSFYVSVNRANGDIVPLHTLPTVPSNRAGEAYNTVVGAPTIEEVLPQAVVGGLDEGVNLQIRRTPDIAGESLTLVPNGTTLDLLGMNEERSWAFVRYATDEGSVTGWANVLFLVEYTYQGEALTFAQLESRNRIETIDDSRRGTEAGEIAAPVTAESDSLADAVTGEVLLDEGAHLQLRRNPDAQAESLGLIPAGERIAILGRTDDATWLQVRYDGRTGWVAAPYIGRLRFNEQPYNVQRLPVEGTGTGPVVADPEATSEVAPEPTAVPVIAQISVDVVGMTNEPGSGGEDLPVLTRGRQVYFHFNSPDGLFSLIELIEDGVTGWVPATSLFFP